MNVSPARILLKDFFEKEGTDLFGVLSLSDCPIVFPDLLQRTLPQARSAVLFALPYRTGDDPGRNVSLYAVAKDYHIALRQVGQRLSGELSALFPEGRFAAFCDHSPLDERVCACKAGLGILGDNGLLITEKYGSFVFIGELLSDLSPEALGAQPPAEIRGCLHCGACKAACPCAFTDCASGIGQKKGELTPEEEALVRKTGLVWGCDLCQTVCPLNRNVSCSAVPFFYEDPTPRIDERMIVEMDKKTLRERAFGWRGKQPLLRNLALFKEKTE